MREIEIKARVMNRMGVVMAARRYGIFFSEQVEQDDAVYKLAKPADEADAKLKMRLRVSGDTVYLTMKYPASEDPKDNHEHETTVGDKAEAEAILTRLGFVPDVKIYKKRQTAKFKDYEICLDDVRGLGEFIEIEKLTEPDADAEEVRSDMLKILKELGINESDRVREDYTMMIRELAAKKTVDGAN